jgi:hypothetical protein
MRDRSYYKAQFFPEGSQVHREPTFLGRSVDAACDQEVLCLLIAGYFRA